MLKKESLIGKSRCSVCVCFVFLPVVLSSDIQLFEACICVAWIHHSAIMSEINNTAFILLAVICYMMWVLLQSNNYNLSLYRSSQSKWERHTHADVQALWLAHLLSNLLVFSSNLSPLNFEIYIFNVNSKQVPEHFLGS